MFASWQESCGKPRQCVEKQRDHSDDEVPYSQGCGLPRGHIQLWGLNCKGGRTLKNGCLRTVVLEKTPESPLDSKEIKPVNPKGNQPWLFIGRTDAEAPIFWLPDAKCQLIGKDPDAGKDWEQEENGMMTEWDGWTASSMDISLSKLLETLKDREAWYAAVHWVTESDRTEWLNNKNNDTSTNQSWHLGEPFSPLWYLIQLWFRALHPSATHLYWFLSTFNQVYWFLSAVKQVFCDLEDPLSPQHQVTHK